MAAVVMLKSMPLDDGIVELRLKGASLRLIRVTRNVQCRGRNRHDRALLRGGEWSGRAAENTATIQPSRRGCSEFEPVREPRPSRSSPSRHDRDKHQLRPFTPMHHRNVPAGVDRASTILAISE